MAFLGQLFDASTVEPAAASGSYPAVPAGKYIMQIISSEMKPTNNGEGQFLALTNEIIEGEYKGARVYDNLNLVNNNQITVDIALKTLSAICHAVGEMSVSDSEVLHFKPFMGTVKFIPEGHVTPGKNGRAAYVQKKDKNEMGGYEIASGSDLVNGPKPAPRPATPTQAARPVAPSAAQARTPAPWGAKKSAA